MRCASKTPAPSSGSARSPRTYDRGRSPGEALMRVDHPIISADSHITEAPNTYIDYIDPAYRDTAPHIVETPDKGDVYVIDGMRRSIPMGLVAAAGKPAEE